MPGPYAVCGVDADGEAGDGYDCSEVGGVGEVVDGKQPLLFGGEGDRHVGGEKTLVRIEEFVAGQRDFLLDFILIVLIGLAGS